MQRDPSQDRANPRVSSIVPQVLTWTLAFSVFLLTACAAAPGGDYRGRSDDPRMVPPPGTTLVIERSTGGGVFKTVQHFDRINKEGSRIRVTGDCMSACTLVLAMARNVCYAPTSRFIFHAAYNSRTGERDEAISMAMVRAMPPRLATWLLKNDAIKSPDHYVIITGAQVAALDDKERLCS